MSSQEITVAQKSAWLSLAAKKNETVAELQRRELALQSILIQSGEDKAATLKEYRAEFTALQNFRKDFTGMIDKALISPMMEYEKRADPKVNVAYKELEAAELKERLELERIRLQQAGIEAERIAFRTHILNEYERVAMQFRQELYHEMLNALLEGHRIEDITRTVGEIKPPAFVRFDAKYLSDAEKADIFNSIKQPDYDFIRLEMIAEGAKGLDHLKQKVDQDTQEAIGNTIINERMAAQTAVQVNAPKVKRNLSLTATNDNWQLIVTAFSTGLYLNRVRVKDMAKLTVQQMATALADYATESGELIDGLEYFEVVK